MPFYIRCISIEYDGVVKISGGKRNMFVQRFMDIYGNYRESDAIVVPTIVGDLFLHPECKGNINTIKRHLYNLSIHRVPIRSNYIDLVMSIMDYDLSERECI